MNKIAKAFENKKAFIGFLTAGDPSLEKTEEFILAMSKAGADLIEIGIPFSDPIAEGEVIERANIRALKVGTTTDNIFDMVKSVREKTDIPFVFLTYINPVFIYGYDRFFNNCKICGIDGIIIPDLPFEERSEVLCIAEKYEIDVITLIAPTSNDRIQTLVKNSSGFIYLVSSLGVTGVRNEINTDLNSIIANIRQVTDTKIAVGFGISTPEQAKKILTYADGVIVGSAIVKIIEEFGDDASEKLSEYMRKMK
ncbi:MAG: tryptophan synthase subunit alpha [Clostridiales bacterium GWF2_38_85]|nr:MAG: tryptophan synthase subunit alpha [Clostridiales bacterium GWF2_38_85]HBL84989.1 tryptophan synthase subunit alpha [Clostridiales bacterium]